MLVAVVAGAGRFVCWELPLAFGTDEASADDADGSIGLEKADDCADDSDNDDSDDQVEENEDDDREGDESFHRIDLRVAWNAASTATESVAVRAIRMRTNGSGMIRPR